MTTKFIMGRDLNGFNAFSLTFSDVNYNMLLVKDIVQTVTLPTESAMYRVIFTVEPGGTIWASVKDTAAYPTGDAALSYSQMNPAVRDLPAGTTISLITFNDSVQAGIEIYAI